MRRLSSQSTGAPLAAPEVLRRVAVGLPRTMPIDVLIPSSGDATACEPVSEAHVQMFERVRESGVRVDYCVVVTPVRADGVALHDYADQLTGDSPDELLELALSGALFGLADNLGDDDELEDA